VIGGVGGRQCTREVGEGELGGCGVVPGSNVPADVKEEGSEAVERLRGCQLAQLQFDILAAREDVQLVLCNQIAPKVAAARRFRSDEKDPIDRFRTSRIGISPLSTTGW